jgi:LysM repeat protein
MTDHRERLDDNFVMNEENTAHEDDDDREEYFEAPVSRWDVRSRRPLLFGAAGLVVVAIVAWLLLSGGNRAVEHGTVQQLEQRLTQMEEKLAKLEWLDQGLARLDKQEKSHDALVAKIDRIEEALRQQSALIDKKIRLLGTKPPAPGASAKKTTAKTGETKSAPAEIYVVKSGDNLFRISRQYGVSVDQLRKLNNLTADSRIFPGQKLKVSP